MNRGRQPAAVCPEITSCRAAALEQLEPWNSAAR